MIRQNKPSRFETRPELLLPALIGLSILLRTAAALLVGNGVTAMPGAADQVSYHTLALRVLDGHGFTFGKNWWPMTAAEAPTAHWSYLYTLYLVAVYRVIRAPLAARLLQAVLVGALHIWLVYRIGERIFNRKVALVAAALTACYAYFIYYAATLMTEPFYITVVLGVFYLAIILADPEASGPRMLRAAALGVLLGITLLLRQVFLVFVPFLYLWLWHARGRRDRRSTLAISAVSIGTLILMILPVSLYNSSRFDRFVLLNTNAGYAFFLANHPVYGTHFIPAREEIDYQALVPVSYRDLDEAALDSALLKLGVQYVLDDPVRYVLLSIDRIPEFFRFWPAPDSGLISNVARVASFGLALPWMAAGIVLTLRERKAGRLSDTLRRPETLILGFAVIYSAVHIFSWALVRYRQPVDAVLIFFAAYALVVFFERIVLKRATQVALAQDKLGDSGS